MVHKMRSRSDIPFISQIRDNIGIEMIFSLVSSAQEFLNVQWDEFKKDEENRLLLKVQEFEEAERVSCVLQVLLHFRN